MYSIEHAVSIWVFIRSIGVGFLIGALYDSFRMFRLFISRSKYSVFVQDIVFFCISAAVSFIFLLESDYGIIRGYILIGEIVGFIIYILTVGRVTFRICTIISARLTKPTARVGLALRKLFIRNKINIDQLDSDITEKAEVLNARRMKSRHHKKKKKKSDN